MITKEAIDLRAMDFIQNVKPRLDMGELQAIAALVKYLKSGDKADIPGERPCKSTI